MKSEIEKFIETRIKECHKQLEESLNNIHRVITKQDNSYCVIEVEVRRGLNIVTTLNTYAEIMSKLSEIDNPKIEIKPVKV